MLRQGELENIWVDPLFIFGVFFVEVTWKYKVIVVNVTSAVLRIVYIIEHTEKANIAGVTWQLFFTV